MYVSPLLMQMFDEMNNEFNVISRVSPMCFFSHYDKMND